ncbi:phenylalanine 4-monooxygenase [Sphingomonas sp. ASV193]|uniref:phenylalanine 4-monooxygenase n=1 Tax=Sphingomonas sp. ASV193 TaxID=3144405 RepID=UPI0032E89AE4
MSHPSTLLEPATHRHRAPDDAEPPPGAAADWTVPQHWDELTAEDHWVWDTLFARQKTLLHDRVVSEFERGLDILSLSRPGVPNFDELSDRLGARTGWSVVAVPGLIPDAVFFDHLANRRFPAGNFMRPPRQMDYIDEPDVFHDVFGHVPLLAQPAVADYMVELGRLGQRAIAIGEVERVARLYWYTIEVGLAREAGQTRIYGAGIASSLGETHYCLESPRPHRLAFDLERVIRTRYRPDGFQKSYFVIDRFDALAEVLRGIDFDALCAAVEDRTDIDPKVARPEELISS